MCDNANKETKAKHDASSACPLVNGTADTLQDMVKVGNNPLSNKPERKLQEEVSMNLQRESRWIREAVDPTFSLKPLECQVKHALDTIDSKDAILFQALSYDAFQSTSGAKKKKSNEVGNASHESTDAPAAPSPYFCELCNRKFTRQSNLTEHMLRHTGKLYQCDVCLKSFSCLRYLTRHSRTHTGEPVVKKETTKTKNNEHKTYVCLFCSKKFSCKSHLVAHTRIHTGEKPYVCQICQKTFNHKSHLTAHTRIHTGERPFQCRICQKQFRDPSNLAGHMRVHNGQKPFACQFCNEQFSYRAQLKKHERTHTDDPQPLFSCQECGKILTDASKLKTHMKIHTANRSSSSSNSNSNSNAKLFACSFCHGQFETKRGQEKTLACDVCTKQFSERIRLQEREHDERAFMIYAVGQQ